MNRETARLRSLLSKPQKQPPQIAAKSGSEVEAVLFGGNVIDVEKLGSYRCLKPFIIINMPILTFIRLRHIQNLTAKQIADSGAGIVLFANTAMGKDLAPARCGKNRFRISNGCGSN